MIWAILPLHTQLATVAPWQTPKSTGCPSTVYFFCATVHQASLLFTAFAHMVFSGANSLWLMPKGQKQYWFSPEYVHMDMPTLSTGKWANSKNSEKLQEEFKEPHIFHTESHSTARSSASLPYRLLYSDELDQALKHPQRSISTAAFMFASGICFGIQPQLSLQREG